MQAVGATHLVVLLVAVAVIAGASGFFGSVVLRRRKRRARGVFVLGFVCGVTAGAILRARRRIHRALGAGRQRTGVPAWRRGTRTDAYRLAARALTLAMSSWPDAGRLGVRRKN
jgi:uncharacterized membrane protein YbhN (UPF0104 family)